MASHVPFLAVRPDEQYSADIKTRDTAIANRILADMDPTETRVASTSRIPSLLQFPLIVITSLSLSSVLNSLASGLTGPELAAVSRDLTEGWHIAVMLGWKVAELGIAWYACYDHLDLAYLTLLNNIPHYFLLNTFFGIDYSAALIPLLIDISSIAVPFALMRNMNKGHADAARKTDNQKVAQDRGVQYLTAVFGSSVYMLVLYGSFLTWLPVYMVIHFDGVRSLEKVHSSNLLLLLGLFVPLGYAATQFIFVPATASSGNPGITDPALAPKKAPFNPETAGFEKHLAYNLGLSEAGFTPRAKMLAKRTAVLAVSSFVNTFVRSYMVIEGTELVGALGWAGVWATAAGLTGLAYAWVGNE